MKDRKRILAIDFGIKRIGVAVSDPLGITAQPVCSINSLGKKKDVAAIIKILEETGAEEIFMGLPVRADGSKGTIYEKVKKFGRSLEAAAGIEVKYLDEKFTSYDADSVLREAGIPSRKRKEVIDRMAAQLILQRYLDKGEANG